MSDSVQVDAQWLETAKTELTDDINGIAKEMETLETGVDKAAQGGEKIDEVSKQLEQVNKGLENVSGDVKTLQETAKAAGDTDYADTLQHIGEIQTYSAVLLLVLVVMVFVQCGMTIGNVVTGRMNAGHD